MCRPKVPKVRKHGGQTIYSISGRSLPPLPLPGFSPTYTRRLTERGSFSRRLVLPENWVVSVSSYSPSFNPEGTIKDQFRRFVSTEQVSGDLRDAVVGQTAQGDAHLLVVALHADIRSGDAEVAAGGHVAVFHIVTTIFHAGEIDYIGAYAQDFNLCVSDFFA